MGRGRGDWEKIFKKRLIVYLKLIRANKKLANI